MSKSIPAHPSALDFLDKSQFEVPVPSSPPSNGNPRTLVATAPTPAGYNSGIYSIVSKLAKDGRDPTPEQLADLFRLMAFDSPLGEMKDEALVIWRRMRSKGIVPTTKGYVALLKVSFL